MIATLQSRRFAFENSAATALIAASMPPMPEAGDHPPGREVAEPVVELVVEQGGDRRHEPAEDAGRLRNHEHAGRHDDEAPQDRGPPANLVREAAEENRAERHAQELRGQHEAE